MNPFTDDNIKELKEQINAGDYELNYAQTVTTILALIARLEATTLCAKHLAAHDDLSPVEKEAIAKWKQSAGK